MAEEIQNTPPLPAQLCVLGKAIRWQRITHAVTGNPGLVLTRRGRTS